jgi:hypothetical protein
MDPFYYGLLRLVGALYILLRARDQSFIPALAVSERVVYVTSGASSMAGDTAITSNAHLRTASFALSAATNGAATIAVAYKAWKVALGRMWHNGF